jgi:hypothetical protein
MKSWIPRDPGKNVKLSLTDDIVELTLQNGKKRTAGGVPWRWIFIAIHALW